MDLTIYNLPQKKKAPPTYLHSIVKEVCEYLYDCNANDPACWRMWLGIGKRIGPGQLKEKLNYVKQKGIKDARYLIACTRLRAFVPKNN